MNYSLLETQLALLSSLIFEFKQGRPTWDWVILGFNFFPTLYWLIFISNFRYFFCKLANMHFYCSLVFPNRINLHKWKILQSIQPISLQGWKYLLSCHWTQTTFLINFWYNLCNDPSQHYQYDRLFHLVHINSWDAT